MDSVGEGERGKIWEDGIETCIISCMKRVASPVQCTILDAWGWCTERPRGMVWGGRRKGGSGWGTHVYLWQIHFDIWQNQYNIVKFKNKIKFKKKDFLILYHKYSNQICKSISSLSPAENRTHKSKQLVLLKMAKT